MTAPNILDPALIADPYDGFEQLREQAPAVLGRSMEGTPAWFVTRHDDVRAVLGDPRFVNSPLTASAAQEKDTLLEQYGIPPELRPYMRASILDVSGADHVRLRKLVSRAFTVRRVNGLRPRVEEITTALLDGLDGSVDLMPAYAHPLPITVICELVGVPESDRPLWGVVDAANAAEQTAVGMALWDIVTYTHELIEQRRREPADDLITDLVRAQDEDGDRLTDVELVTMVVGLVSAGHETTKHLIANGTLALLTHPDQLAVLRRDPTLWPNAVNELMRWCGPVQVGQVRYATEDAELAGVTVRAGEAVQVVLVSASHDPRVYDDPARLDVTRRPPERGEGHLGFGHGFHFCLGAALARQEGEVALRSLFDRFPGIALETSEPRWAQVPGMRQLATLPVRLRSAPLPSVR